MSTGDPDFYKAFCWRFLQLVSKSGGRISVVLPRSVLASGGSADFRRIMFEETSKLEVVILRNTKQWVFDNVDGRYHLCLLCAKCEKCASSEILLRGPFASKNSFLRGLTLEAVSVKESQVLDWTDTASLPALPSNNSLGTFLQLREAPRLDTDRPDEWHARPHRELDATNDRPLIDLESESCPKGYWKVYSGESFGIWEPDIGKYYGYADPITVREKLQGKRAKAQRRRSGVHGQLCRKYLLDPSTLPCNHPRVAFRDVTGATNTRTVIAALIPPQTFITHKGPYFLWPRGDARDQAYLLGVLSSIPLDWYARRMVELSLSYYVINPFPIPRPPQNSLGWKRVVELAGRLACPDERFEEWAQSVGVGCGALEGDQKQDHIFELDAVVAHLYGLTEEHIRHIFETFHEGWDYQSRLDGVLQYYRSWKEKL